MIPFLTGNSNWLREENVRLIKETWGNEITKQHGGWTGQILDSVESDQVKNKNNYSGMLMTSHSTHSP